MCVCLEGVGSLESIRSKCAEVDSGPLQEQASPVPAEPRLQPPECPVCFHATDIHVYTDLNLGSAYDRKHAILSPSVA